MTILYREIDNIADLEQLVDLETQVWQMAEREAVPVNILHAIAHSGGCVIGAYDGKKLIGFALALIARDNQTYYLWSHMAAVQPAYQAQGIGFQLKQQQRQWAVARGYDVLRWTFDPLLRGNANFNLHRLGAIATAYHVNFYGAMRDGLNAGLDSDRLEITWHLHTPRVMAHALGTFAPFHAAFPTEFLLKTDAGGAPVLHIPPRLEAAIYGAEIPYDMQRLKQTQPDSASTWQKALREALQTALAMGYSVVDFIGHNGKCWYVLQK
jgi:predicted GNAT superfamily acetyltransferase